MIYAIAPDVSASEVTVIKFGKSKNPMERLCALQSGNAVRLKIYAEVDWPDSFERRIHDRFASKRQVGEWFSVDDEIHDFMNLMIGHPQEAKAFLDQAGLDITAFVDFLIAERETTPISES